MWESEVTGRSLALRSSVARMGLTPCAVYAHQPAAHRRCAECLPSCHGRRLAAAARARGIVAADESTQEA